MLPTGHTLACLGPGSRALINPFSVPEDLGFCYWAVMDTTPPSGSPVSLLPTLTIKGSKVDVVYLHVTIYCASIEWTLG